MIFIHQDALISSDWHILHRNIYWFLPESRGIISGVKNPKQLLYEQFIEAEENTYQKILALIQQLVESRKIHQFIFIGDLVFGFNKPKEVSKKIQILTQKLPVFFEIFQFLESQGIKRRLILGNHDDFKLKNAKAKSLYNLLFDEIGLFIRDNNYLYTHFPLGYSDANDKSRGTPDEKYYRMNKIFYKLDKQLLEELGHTHITNFHGHIHAQPFLHPIENVSYQNVAIDVLCNENVVLD
jgi:hypothetical protein